MIATMVLESLLIIYAIWRYRLTLLTRLAVLILAALAVFQLAEYFVCTGYGVEDAVWSRLGFVAIAALPALGLHILHILADNPKRRLVYLNYGMMAAFMGFFVFSSQVFSGYQCTGNYVIFQLRPLVGGVYYVYYYGWLFTAICLGARWATQLRSRGAARLRQLQAVQGMVLGYLVFLVPVTLANTVSPATRRGIPSIMCGFAVLFALILALYVLPRAAERKSDAPA